MWDEVRDLMRCGIRGSCWDFVAYQCTSLFNPPPSPSYRGYTENPGPGFDAIFNAQTLSEPGCNEMYIIANPDASARFVLIPDPDSGKDFWDVDVYDTYESPPTACDTTLHYYPPYDEVAIDADTNHYNLGYEWMLTTQEGDGDGVYDEFVLDVQQVTGNTDSAPMRTFSWSNAVSDCQHTLDGLYVDVVSAGVTGSEDAYVNVYADDGCSELIVNELFSVRTSSAVVSETRTIYISTVCEDKDLNDNVVEVEVDGSCGLGAATVAGCGRILILSGRVEGDMGGDQPELR